MSPSTWATLGLMPGSDRAEIHRAYARKLRGTNPEDDPDGFKALRQAYELAMRYADSKVFADLEAAAEAAAEVASGADAEANRFEQPGDDDGTVVCGAHGSEPSPAAPARPAPRSPEAERLDELLHRFAALLDDPAGFDRGELVGVFDEIVASTALTEIAAAEHAERWIAFHIARSIPRSDFIIDRAVAEFGWADREMAGRTDWAIGEILWRVEEWQYIHWAASEQSSLRVGWRALTEEAIPAWRMRIEALSSARVNQVESLLRTADEEMRGLYHHFQPDRVQWWQRHLSRARTTLDTLLLAPLVGYLFFFATVPARELGAPAIPVLVLGLAISAAAPLLYLRLIKQRHYEWQNWLRGAPPAWFDVGWIAAAVALPLAAMAMPGGPVGALATATLAAGAALWTAAAVPPHHGLAGLGARLRDAGARGWHLGIAAVTSVGMLPAALQVQWWSVAAAAGFVWWRGRDSLLLMIERRVTRWRLAVGVAGALSIVAAVALGTAQLEQETRLYIVLLSSVLCLPVLVLTWTLSPESNKFPLVLCWVVLFFVWVSAQPPAPSQSAPDPAASVPVAVPEQTPAQASERSLERSPYCDGPNPDLENCIWRTPEPVAENGRRATEAELRLLEQMRRGASSPRPEPVPARRVQPPPTVRCPPDAATAGPRRVEPCGSTSSWFVESDYPEETLRRGISGTTRVLLDVSSTGRVTACRVERSSGAAALDAATCRVMKSRGRFLPRRDADGNPVEAQVAFGMTWQIRN